MKIQIDSVNKENRKYFKEGILKAINNKGNVYFTLNKAIIEITEPYFATEQGLIDKSRNKKAVYKFIHDFRLYQFNQ